LEAVATTISCKSRFLWVGPAQINGPYPCDNNMLQVCFLLMLPLHEKTNQETPLVCQSPNVQQQQDHQKALLPWLLTENISRKKKSITTNVQPTR
jgi:hypothetical protein